MRIRNFCTDTKTLTVPANVRGGSNYLTRLIIAKNQVATSDVIKVLVEGIERDYITDLIKLDLAELSRYTGQDESLKFEFV